MEYPKSVPRPSARILTTLQIALALVPRTGMDADSHKDLADAEEFVDRLQEMLIGANGTPSTTEITVTESTATSLLSRET